MIFVSSLSNYCCHNPEVLIWVTLKTEFNTQASFHIPVHWLTTPVFGLQDTLSFLTTVNSLLIRCTAAELLILLTQFTLVLTQCLPTHTRIRVVGTGGTRLKKRFSFFNTLCQASGCPINSDCQCVPQLVFPLHRRFYQKVTESQNVPTVMTIFVVAPCISWSHLISTPTNAYTYFFYIKTFKIAPTCFDPKIIFRELHCSLLKHIIKLKTLTD